MGQPHATDERLGPNLLHESVEVDIGGLGARTLPQEDVAALNEAKTKAIGGASRLVAARMERGTGREQGAGQVRARFQSMRRGGSRQTHGWQPFESKLYVLYFAAVDERASHAHRRNLQQHPR